MKHFAVMGDPIAHSLSPKIHSLFSEQTHIPLDYQRLQVSALGFSDALTHFKSYGHGLNITAPLKELAFRYCDQLTPRAKLAKSVNTIKIDEKGSLIGDNTDGQGLVNDLNKRHHFSIKGKKIVIVGAGGAARGIIPSLLENGPSLLGIVNRTPEKAHRLAKEFNTLGAITSHFSRVHVDLMVSNIPQINSELLTPYQSCPFLYNINYSHVVEEDNALGMLVEQAALSFEFWFGILPETKSIFGTLK